MRNYIILNGVNSNTITGLLISKLPPITKPKIRTQTEEIDGRDGDIITKLGYSAYDKEIEIGLYGDFDIDDVIAYFNSEGTVTFSNEPDKFYNYQIVDQIDYEKLIRFKKAKVKMHVQPFKYPLEETPVEITVQTVNDEAEEIDLDNTKEAPMKIDLKGNGSNNLFNIGTTADYTGIGVVNKIENDILYIQIMGSGGTVTHNQSIKYDTNKDYYIQSKSSIALGRYYIRVRNQNDTAWLTSNDMTLEGWSYNQYYSGWYKQFNTTEMNTQVNIPTGSYWDIGFGFQTTNPGNIETISEIMINEGTTALPYEPYGASVSGDNSIEVCGKNKLSPTSDFETTHNSVTFKGNNGIYTIKGTATGGSASISKTLLTKEYTIKNGDYLHLGNTSVSASTSMTYFFTDNTSDYKTFNTTNRILDLSSYVGKTINGISFWVANNLQVDLTIMPMILNTSTATTYEEYKSASYPISLGDIELNTGDSIQYITDKWYIVRANETQEEITDATLISQLQALKNASSYDNKTHISQTNDSKPFILNATALQKGSGETTVTNEGNIYSKPTLDIEGSGTVGIYLDGNQMFTIDLSNSNECVIDTTKLEAYNPTTSELMNRQVTGDYSNFKLNAGDNQIQATGDITKVTISNYTRWL